MKIPSDDEQDDAAVPETAEARIGRLEAALSAQQQRLRGMLTIAASLARSRDPKRAMRAIVSEVSALLDAERTTIYEYRGDEKMLQGLAVQGETSIEVGVPMGQGIAGVVAATGKPINLKDAYRHKSFDPRFDKATGFRTRSMLCVPMRTPSGEVVGVVQVMNKRVDYFTMDDQYLLESLAGQAAITLGALHLQVRLDAKNIELQELTADLQQRVDELELLHAIEMRMADAPDVVTLCARVLSESAAVVRAEATAVFLPEEHEVGPVYVSGPPDGLPLTRLSRIEVGEGVLGKAAGRGRTIYASRAVDEVQPTEDEASEEREAIEEPFIGQGAPLRLDDVLAVPLVDGGVTLGAFALINRRGVVRRRREDDEQLADLIAAQLARGVVRLREQRSAQSRDRLMTIGQMLSGVLHDLRGPMAIISGYSQLMAEQEDAAERADMAAAIRRQVNLFNDMTREVMSFVRGERTVFSRRVYLNKFVEQVRELLVPEFKERGIEFVVENESVEGVALFDEPKMLRVVTNIARNARQAMGDEGRFRWRIVDQPGGGTLFELSDTGPGIPEAIRDRLFEAFTTSGKEDGTGLGLAIVRRIVEDHGGTVTFTTETGRGTTFFVHLPGPPATVAP
jgi:signal transduction histidine kinase/putative methionine-R-sulfoxide reductase with GAF domain